MTFTFDVPCEDDKVFIPIIKETILVKDHVYLIRKRACEPTSLSKVAYHYIVRLTEKINETIKLPLLVFKILYERQGVVCETLPNDIPMLSWKKKEGIIKIPTGLVRYPEDGYNLGAVAYWLYDIPLGQQISETSSPSDEAAKVAQDGGSLRLIKKQKYTSRNKLTRRRRTRNHNSRFHREPRSKYLRKTISK